MKKNMIGLNEHDLKIIRVLETFGYNKPKAKCYLFFQMFEIATAKEIEDTVYEAQPCINIALNEMLREGLLSTRTIHHAGKGRPILEYHRKVLPFVFVEERATEKIKSIQRNLELLYTVLR